MQYTLKICKGSLLNSENMAFQQDTSKPQTFLHTARRVWVQTSLQVSCTHVQYAYPMHVFFVTVC